MNNVNGIIRSTYKINTRVFMDVGKYFSGKFAYIESKEHNYLVVLRFEDLLFTKDIINTNSEIL